MAKQDKVSMILKYWGVRGSIPSPLPINAISEKQLSLIQRILKDGGTEKLFAKSPGKQADKIRSYLSSLPQSLSGTYGGETTCIEVQIPDTPLIIFDAGTGIRHLGKILLKRLCAGEPLNPLSSDKKNGREIHLFLSHYHWDHLQGVPFFAPGFVAGPLAVNIHFYGKKNTQNRLSEVLAGMQQSPNFPIEWSDMPCGKNFVELGRMESQSIKIGKAEIHYQQLTHPDVVFGYSISALGKKFVFATDTEHKDSPDPRLLRLAQNADILYYDSQYLPEEYIGCTGCLTGAMNKFDWGHSTYEWAIRNGLAANIKTIMLGHHEPERDDFQLEDLWKRARDFLDNQLKLPENKGKQQEVLLAYQGLEQTL